VRRSETVEEGVAEQVTRLPLVKRMWTTAEARGSGESIEMTTVEIEGNGATAGFEKWSRVGRG
jgi:hypothetical protein